MKYFLLVAALVLSTIAAKATTPGVYVGCAGGYAFITRYDANGMQWSYQVRTVLCDHDWAVKVAAIPMTEDPAGNPTNAAIENRINMVADATNEVTDPSSDWVSALDALVGSSSSTAYVYTGNLNAYANTLLP